MFVLFYGSKLDEHRQNSYVRWYVYVLRLMKVIILEALFPPKIMTVTVATSSWSNILKIGLLELVEGSAR